MTEENKIYTQRRKENPKLFFAPDQWEKFIYACDIKWRPFFWMMMLTGVRHNELKYVKVNDIDFKNKWIIILKAKGGRNRIRYANLSSYACRFFKDYIKDNNLNGDSTLGIPTRQGMRQYMHKICKKQSITGWADMSTHNLRKTHENYLFALNKDGIKVVAHMGHTGKTASEHYASSAFIKDKKELDMIRQWLGDVFE